MGYRAYTERQPDARRRLWLLLAGAGFSVTPIVGFLIALSLGVRNLPDWVYLVIIGPLLLFPLTMAYVVVVHRAMDVRVVVRQGLRYLLARGSLRALQGVVSGAILAGVLALVSRSASVVAQALLLATGFAIVLLLRRFSDTLRERVDRRFFRDAYDADQILSDLASEVRTMIEDAPAARDRDAPDRRGAARAAGGDPLERGRHARGGACDRVRRHAARDDAGVGADGRPAAARPHARCARRRRVVAADGRRRRAARAGAARTPSCCCRCRSTRSWSAS